MRNLIPHIAIALIGFIGLIAYGIIGLLVGLIGGYILVTILGLLGFFVSGGILPKTIRKQAAEKFVKEYGDSLFANVIPTASTAQKVYYVESLIERIYRKSSFESPSTHSGISFDDVEKIIDEIINQEPDDDAKEIIINLWHFLQEEWYGGIHITNDGSNHNPNIMQDKDNNDVPF